MARELTAAEQEFIARFDSEHRSDSQEKKAEAQKNRIKRRRSYIFNGLLVMLAVAPFAISGIFLYALGRFEASFGNDSFSYMRDNLTDEQIRALGDNSGVSQLAAAVELYDQRGFVVSIIFTVFIVLIAAMLLGRIAVNALQRSSHVEE